MQTLHQKKIFIPAFFVLMAVMVISLAPMSPAVAQELGNEDSQDQTYDEKSYEGKDGKSCAEKKNKSSTEAGKV